MLAADRGPAEECVGEKAGVMGHSHCLIGSLTVGKNKPSQKGRIKKRPTQTGLPMAKVVGSAHLPASVGCG